MSHRYLAWLGAAAALVIAPAQIAAQTRPAKTWTAPRTAERQPDLQGVWSSASVTPFERPKEFAGKEFFTEAEAAGWKDVLSRQYTGWPDGEIVHTDHRAHQAADRLRVRRDLQPMIQSAAFIGFEVAEANMPDLRHVDEPRDRLAQRRKHAAESRMEQQRLLVFHEKVAKLQIDFGNKD